ncbi:MAG: PEP-CTERM sorting domain-containing protein [Verrucomicrobiaceae bacterium]
MKLFTHISILSLSLSAISYGQTLFSNLNFDFSEATFGSGAISGTQGYNIINDSTGEKLTTDNADLDDIFITVTSNVPSATGAFADAELVSGGGLRSNHGFSNNFSATYPLGAANNPGTVVSQTIRITFANHLSITDFEMDFTSLNTRGRTWEHSQIALLDENGNYFSSEPSLGDYNTWKNATVASDPSWNIGSEAAGNGASGSPSEGWFVTASTATVTDVGTVLSGAGSNGSRENMTGTNGDSVFNYDDVNLAPGTRIGGYEWTTFVEDTRGQNNNFSSWTTTQSGLTLTSTVPEPSSALLALLGASALLRRRR